MAAISTIELSAAAAPEANARLTDMLRALQQALRAALDAGRAGASDTASDSALDAAFAAYDAYIAFVIGAHPVSCRVGCTACCHDNPRGVTGIELNRLAAAIAGFPDRDAVLSAFALLHNADRIFRKIGRTGTRAIGRVMGLLLAAIAVQFIIDGVVAAAQMKGLLG